MLYPQQLVGRDTDGKAGEFFVSELGKHNVDYPAICMKLTPDESPRVTLVAYGAMAPLAVQAALNVFLREEILVEVVVPSLIKPLPLADILSSARSSGRVVIAEEGVRTGGWGAELAALLHESAAGDLVTPVRRVGALDLPIPSAKSLEERVLPQVADIEKAIYGAALH